MQTRISRRPFRRLRGAAICCVAGLLVAGCAVGPDYHRPDVPLPPAWRGPQADAADVVNTAWWEAFGDSALTDLITAALQANQDIQLAALRIEESLGRLQVGQAAQFPQLSGAASPQRIRLSEQKAEPLALGVQPYNYSYEVSLSASWEIDLWGRVQRANEAARAELLAREESRHGVLLTVATLVATSYVQLVALDQQLALTGENLKNRRDTLALIDTKYRGGSATSLDVARVRAAVEDIEATMPDIERQIASVEYTLSALLARSPGPITRGSFDALKVPAIPQGVPSDVLARRPDVMAAEQELIAANARIGVAKAQYFPVLSLTGVLGLSSNELSKLVQKSATFGSIGPQILQVIFDGGRIEGDVRQAEALQKQAVVRYLQSVTTALKEVEDALVSRSKAGERTVAMERQLRSRREIAALVRLRFQGGRSDLLEVLDAELQQQAVEEKQAQSRRDHALALIAVYKAMGGGWMAEQDRLRLAEAGSVDVAASAPTRIEHWTARPHRESQE